MPKIGHFVSILSGVWCLIVESCLREIQKTVANKDKSIKYQKV